LCIRLLGSRSATTAEVPGAGPEDTKTKQRLAEPEQVESPLTEREAAESRTLGRSAAAVPRA
jgi:hypothetical protein